MSKTVPEGFFEPWLIKTDAWPDPQEYVKATEKKRKSNNLKPQSAISRALLQKQFADHQDYHRFIQQWCHTISENENDCILDLLADVKRMLTRFALRELPGKASDVAIAIAAGMKEIEQPDFVKIAAQSLYWHIYRVSSFCGSDLCSSVSAWATAHQRIAYECTATGAQHQKNKISSFSLMAADRFWIAVYGSKEMISLHDFAKKHDLDTRLCIWQIAKLLEGSYANLPKQTLAASDYVLKKTILSETSKKSRRKK